MAEEMEDEWKDPEGLDLVDHRISMLGMSLNCADPNGSILNKGYKNENEEIVWKAVYDDYRALSDAIIALREDKKKDNQHGK